MESQFHATLQTMQKLMCHIHDERSGAQYEMISKSEQVIQYMGNTSDTTVSVITEREFGVNRKAGQSTRSYEQSSST